MKCRLSPWWTINDMQHGVAQWVLYPEQSNETLYSVNVSIQGKLHLSYYVSCHTWSEARIAYHLLVQLMNLCSKFATVRFVTCLVYFCRERKWRWPPSVLKFTVRLRWRRQRRWRRRFVRLQRCSAVGVLQIKGSRGWKVYQSFF